MARFEEYADRFQFARLEREDGILQMTLHTDGESLQWGSGPHTELPEVFHTIGTDPETKVIIMTGAGDVFTGPAGSSATVPRRTPEQWDATYWEGKHLLGNLLNIEVPIIAAVNGPALRHSELPLLSDIVLSAPHTTFQDSGHFMSGLTPGDGMHIIYPLLLGMNRGRYFLLTGQMLDATQAQELGLVAEVLPQEELLPRAWELARQLAQQPRLVLRYSRVLLTHKLKQELHDLLGYGLALEGLGSGQDYLDRGPGR
jgi:enoyl-CoA hydratase/carnithine racemase